MQTHEFVKNLMCEHNTIYSICIDLCIVLSHLHQLNHKNTIAYIDKFIGIFKNYIVLKSPLFSNMKIVSNFIDFNEEVSERVQQILATSKIYPVSILIMEAKPNLTKKNGV